eukprot:1817205-Pleurochrysis_carterae.AAC.1
MSANSPETPESAVQLRRSLAMLTGEQAVTRTPTRLGQIASLIAGLQCDLQRLRKKSKRAAGY